MTILNRYFVRKNLEKDLLIISVIIVLPFIFFMYKLVPETRIWTTDLFIIDSGEYYNNANFFIWFICVKLMTLILLTIWFITCMYRWRYALFFPMIFEIFKLSIIIEALHFEKNHFMIFFDSLLFSIPYIILVLLLANYINYYKFSKPINERINSEINDHLVALSKFDVHNYKSIRKEFYELKNKKHKMDTKKYLVKLIKLRDNITV